MKVKVFILIFSFLYSSNLNAQRNLGIGDEDFDINYAQHKCLSQIYFDNYYHYSQFFSAYSKGKSLDTIVKLFIIDGDTTWSRFIYKNGFLMESYEFGGFDYKGKRYRDTTDYSIYTYSDKNKTIKISNKTRRFRTPYLIESKKIITFSNNNKMLRYKSDYYEEEDVEYVYNKAKKLIKVRNFIKYIGGNIDSGVFSFFYFDNYDSKLNEKTFLGKNDTLGIVKDFLKNPKDSFYAFRMNYINLKKSILGINKENFWCKVLLSGSLKSCASLIIDSSNFASLSYSFFDFLKQSREVFCQKTMNFEDNYEVGYNIDISQKSPTLSIREFIDFDYLKNTMERSKYQQLKILSKSRKTETVIVTKIK